MHRVAVQPDGGVVLRQPAEEVDPPADGGQRHRLLLQRLHRRGGDDHVCTTAAALRQHNGRQIFIQRINRPVGPQSQRLLAPPGGRLADDDPRRAAQPGQHHVQHANRPRAHDQHHVARADADLVLPAPDAGQRLDERGHGRVYVGRNRHQVTAAHGRRRHAQVLGKRAVQRDADGLELWVEVVVAADRLAAVAPAHVGGDEQALAERVAADALADGRHLADDLMTRDAPRAGGVQAVAAVVDAQVGAADVGPQHAQQDLVRANLRHGYILNTNIVGTVVDGGEHVHSDEWRATSDEWQNLTQRSPSTQRTPRRVLLCVLGALSDLCVRFLSSLIIHNLL